MSGVDDVLAISEALSSRRYRYASEVELHQALSTVLTGASIDHEREVAGPGGRIDMLAGRVGIEVKVKGSADAARRQLSRYADSGRFDQLLLVTTRPAHGVIAGRWAAVPVHVLTIGGLSL